jgi:hypothetical protein
VSAARNVASGARISTSGMLGGRGALVGQVFAVFSVAALSSWYYAAHRQPSMDRYHGLVTALGWIGIGLSLLATALSIRKRVAYQGVGRLSGWMRAHVYLGVVAAFAILYHSSFRTGSPLTAWLLAFFSLTP